eukprot:TRINITY_DN314_c0_g9_i1.p1 TRINITY_DN314_c0_g9~~TRINITY_DN314_c0_g9_i1.p1  ORF type:complete len:201 (-),score=38.71 TRINITY_DN314_c0_g9_i1:382-984(-)
MLVQKRVMQTEQPSQEEAEPLSFHVLVPVLSSVLTKIVKKNDSIPLTVDMVTVFHALKAPEIQIQSYLERIVRYGQCSPECVVLALIYLDRIVQRNEGFFLSSLNIHRLLITSIMVAAKFFDDRYYNNSYYARIGGVSAEEMNALELEFLTLTNFSLHVSPDTFSKYRMELLFNFERLCCPSPAMGGSINTFPTKIPMRV